MWPFTKKQTPSFKNYFVCTDNNYSVLMNSIPFDLKEGDRINLVNIFYTVRSVWYRVDDFTKVHSLTTDR